MDLCRLKKSYFISPRDSLYRFSILKELFLSTTFKIVKIGNTHVSVSLSQEFLLKAREISPNCELINPFFLNVIDVRFLTFVDLWEEKRRG